MDINVFQDAYDKALNHYLQSGSDEQKEMATNIKSKISEYTTWDVMIELFKKRTYTAISTSGSSKSTDKRPKRIRTFSIKVQDIFKRALFDLASKRKTSSIVIYRVALSAKNKNVQTVKATADTFKISIALSADEKQVINQLYHTCNERDFQALAAELATKGGLTAGERFVRGALTQTDNLWKSGTLNDLQSHGEDWCRINVLSMLWDGAFLYEQEYLPKRSKYKLLHQKGITNYNRIDFIYRTAVNCNLLIGEEKRPDASEAKCICITNREGKHIYLHYTKANFTIPEKRDNSAYQKLARCLAFAISFYGRHAIHTHEKLNYITEAAKKGRTADMDTNLKNMDLVQKLLFISESY
ncbi:hypothetical protein BJV82DRAFT_664422 [Fennellomyces sp. T-0311]|nr:hypothetical protein BJV82DRAFT_664422 [Fennellomyces sp. T-0311]